MPDREKVIKGLEVCIDRKPGKYTCNECPYEIDGNNCEVNMSKDALALLKEQEEQIESLKQTAQSMMEGVCLLKDQGPAIKPRIDEEMFKSGQISEVVRCKDCRFRQSRVSRIIDGKECNLCEIVKDYKPANWFCADGERCEGH